MLASRGRKAGPWRRRQTRFDDPETGMDRLTQRHAAYYERPAEKVEAARNGPRSATAPAAWRCSPRSAAHLLVLRVAFRVSVGDYLRWSRPRVQITKAAITGEYVTQMVARLECRVLAVQVRTAPSDTNLGAPRGIAISSAGRSPKRHRPGECSNAKCQFRKDFCHEGASFVFIWFLNTAREKPIPLEDASHHPLFAQQVR